MQRRLFVVGAAIVTAGALFAACGSGGAKMNAQTELKSGSAPATPAPAAIPAPPGASSANAYKVTSTYASGNAVPGAAPAASNQPASAPAPQQLDRKIIMNAELEIKVKDADDAIAAITAAAKEAGGYAQETRQQGTRQQGRQMSVTLRIPAGSYESIVTRIAKMGEEVLNRREWTNDVTAEYLDLEGRIKTQEIHLAQLNKLYEKGGSIKEMMELEQEIARVTSDLEGLKGRYRFLSNQVAFSTVTVRMYEPGSPMPLKAAKTVTERIRNNFIESWHGVVNFTGDLVVFAAGALPVLVYLSIFGGLGYGAYRLVRGRFPRRPPAA